MSNPALNKTFSAEELRRMYEQPSADPKRPGIDGGAASAQAVQTAVRQQDLGGGQRPPVTGDAQPMTYQTTLNKTLLTFIAVLAGAAIGWMTVTTIPFLWIGGAIVGLVFGLINAFKREPNPALILIYAVAQGLFLGGISSFYEAMYPGIVSQAVIGTLAVFAVTLFLFRSGKVRTSPKMTKIVLIAMGGYLVFSLVNVVLMVTGAVTDPWGLRNGWIGIAIGLLAVFLAAYSLVMDFETIKRGVEARVPERYSWAAAFGLTVTLIWLYLEILRIIAIFRGD